ncbi:hypothetical protein H6F89_34180 [Cyanobacteria bacterium FACHB-63]|nr:hypothetical protein [Cyanobacteria bacterium FACHB-63]
MKFSQYHMKSCLNASWDLGPFLHPGWEALFISTQGVKRDVIFTLGLPWMDSMLMVEWS